MGRAYSSVLCVSRSLACLLEQFISDPCEFVQLKSCLANAGIAFLQVLVLVLRLLCHAVGVGEVGSKPHDELSLKNRQLVNEGFSIDFYQPASSHFKQVEDDLCLGLRVLQAEQS